MMRRWQEVTTNPQCEFLGTLLTTWNNFFFHCPLTLTALYVVTFWTYAVWTHFERFGETMTRWFSNCPEEWTRKNGRRSFTAFSDVVGLIFNRITPGCLLSGRITQSPKCSSRVTRIRFSAIALSNISWSSARALAYFGRTYNVVTFMTQALG